MSPIHKPVYQGAVIETSHGGRWVVTPIRTWRYRGTSPYQTIAIGDADVLGTCLFLDGWMQLAEADEYIYHEHLVLPALLAHPHPEHVLILGGGDGLAARELFRHDQVDHVTLVDLDDVVVQVCRKYLAHMQEGVLDNPRLSLRIEDARDYLRNTSEHFDVIVVDLVDLMPETLHLFERVFDAIPGVLDKGGIVVTHGPDPGPPQYEGLLAITFLRQRFSHTVWYKGFITSFGETWTFAMGSNDIDFKRIQPEVWQEHAAHLRQRPRSLVPEALPALFLHPPSEEEIVQRFLTGELSGPHEQWQTRILDEEKMAQLGKLTGLC